MHFEPLLRIFRLYSSPDRHTMAAMYGNLHTEGFP